VIVDSERKKMLKARSIGAKMVEYLERIGIERLSDLRGADPHVIAMRIDVELGRKHMNAMGVAAIANLVALAEAEDGG
jgi:nucleotidyltransferase/DNA polymerase involved in DNA repair